MEDAFRSIPSAEITIIEANALSAIQGIPNHLEGALSLKMQTPTAISGTEMSVRNAIKDFITTLE